MSRFEHIKENIKNDWFQLRQNWQDCIASWNDGATHSFEREYWQEYENILPNAINELEKLDYLIQQARDEVQ